MAKQTERNVSFGEDNWRNSLYVELKRTGGDPSHLFEVLEGIINQRAWENLLDEQGNPVGSFRRLIEAPLPVGVGQSADKILKLLELEHRYEHNQPKWNERMRVLRDAVRKELDAEIEPLNPNGTNRHTVDKSRDSITTPRNVEDRSSEYIIARLKRDNPELADKVISGKLTANRAAIEAGIRKERFTVPNHDMELAAKALKSKLSGDQIEELIAHLVGMID